MLKDIFDIEFVDELKGLYTTTIWSEIDEDLRRKC